MAEYIDKEDVLEILGAIPQDLVYEHIYELKGIHMQTEDIVRCNNCKHSAFLTSFPERYRCKLGNGAHRLDYFCADGKKKEGYIDD